MNNNNPFTVPDGFFEKETASAMTRASAIRRRRIVALSVAAVLVLAFPVAMHVTSVLSPANDAQLALTDPTLQDDALAANYFNDIFLQVNF